MDRNRRTLQELTFKDNFLFAATLLDPENCRLVLERILEIPIERVEVSKEKSIVYHPEYRGVRLDVFARDEMHTHYDVEMQIAAQHIPKRARYYHSHMDMIFLFHSAIFCRSTMISYPCKQKVVPGKNGETVGTW